jgi:hypothetical protein
MNSNILSDGYTHLREYNCYYLIILNNFIGY